MRFLSVILFLAMAAVLPVAGLQQYFCTMNMEFVDGANDCPKTQKDCCEKSHKEESSTPDCMVSAKVLPNAEKSSPVQLPAVDGMWTMVPIVFVNLAPACLVEHVSPQTDRGPPDESRVFLRHRRLLI